MKPKKLDQRRLSANLGSTIRGRVTAGAGHFGALELAESVRGRFRPPAGGGRARDRGWTMKRLIAVKPEPLIFKRGEFSFNRRFFETRFSGFFKVMPSEAEKNLILVIKCAKGEFKGRRISKISATELSLQLFTAGGASSEESILFNDIFEVQVRQKDEA